jgi:hypothetical protein
MRAAYPRRTHEVPPLSDEPGLAMMTLALFAVAALTFSVLTGVIEGFLARRARRRFQAKASPLLHPLTHHGPRRVRKPHSWLALHHIGLFFAFFLVTYVGVLLLRALHSVVADFF